MMIMTSYQETYNSWSHIIKLEFGLQYIKNVIKSFVFLHFILLAFIANSCTQKLFIGEIDLSADAT